MDKNDFLPEIPDGKDIPQRSDFLKEDEWFDVDITKDILDVTQDYSLPRFSLRINGVPCAPVGGIHGITGQSGHGKTMALTMLMAAYLGDEEHGMAYMLADQTPKPKILYVDTEMEPENTMMVNCRVCAMLGWNFHEVHDQFTIMCLRNELSAENRWKKILKATETYKPNVVFIDGLIDIVSDFNDNKMCQERIFRLMATASHYDISLWVILHQNPNSTKMIGHAGSFLERKATDIFETKKEKQGDNVSFKLRQGKARGKDVPDLVFCVSDARYRFGVPELLTPQQQALAKVTSEECELRAIMRKYLPDAAAMTWTALRDELKKGEGKCTARAGEMIKDAFKLGIIEQDRISNKIRYINETTEEKAPF